MTSDTTVFFFFNDTATTEIYTLSLHDALPIWRHGKQDRHLRKGGRCPRERRPVLRRGTDEHNRLHPCHRGDRKSTRLNSSHLVISYAVFCLKKKKQHQSHLLIQARLHRQSTLT